MTENLAKLLECSQQVRIIISDLLHALMERYCQQHLDTIPLWERQDLSKDEIITELTETLNWIMPKFHLPYHEGELLNCGKATCEAYRTAIAKVEELAAKALEKK